MSRTFAVVSSSAFMVFLDATVVNVAFPDIRESFPGESLADLSWILSSYSIVFAALLVPFGRIADRAGQRRVFVAGLAAFTAASGACAAAPSLEVLVAARVAQAIGGAAMIPASQALLMAAYPRERRVAVIGIWSAVAAVAAAAGPPLGGVLVEAADWRLAFVVNVPVGLAAVAAALAWIPRDRRVAAGERPDLAGALSVVLGVGALTLALVQGEWWGWSDARVVGAFAGALLLVGFFVRRCARHPAPVVDLALFRLRTCAAGNAATLLLGSAMFAVLLANALFLTSVWGYSVLEAGLALTPTPLVAALAAPVAGAFADRGDPRLVAIPGIAAFMAGTAVFVGAVGTEPAFVAQWLPATALTGLGLGLAYATLSGVTVRELDDEAFGLGSGVSAMTRQLGAALGVAMLVAVLGRPAPGAAAEAFDQGWLAAGGVAALAAIPCLAVPRGAHARRTRDHGRRRHQWAQHGTS